MFKEVETGVSMYWIGNWIGSYPICYFISRYWYDDKPKYWDLELDWGISEVMHMFKDVETGVSMYRIWIWIWSFPRQELIRWFLMHLLNKVAALVKRARGNKKNFWAYLILKGDLTFIFSCGVTGDHLNLSSKYWTQNFSALLKSFLIFVVSIKQWKWNSVKDGS